MNRLVPSCVSSREARACLHILHVPSGFHHATGPIFGHAGDGNLHCILPLRDDDTAEYLDKVHEVNERLVRRALAVGGSCTGEHGVGMGKIKYLREQYDAATIAAMATVKRAFDPTKIMNPGKVLDERDLSSWNN